MDQQFDFRALLIKLQDCLSDNDRRRLHFIVGDTIPRHLRDDPTLGGTLSLLESLFDRAKISEQDFDYLIHAFSEIHCYQAVKRLKEHQLAQFQRNRSGSNTSTTVSDLFADNEDDKFHITKVYPISMLSNSSEGRSSISSQFTSISFDSPNMNMDKLPLTKGSMESEKQRTELDLSSMKQTLKSRLTTCQLILFLLNFLSILTLMILIIYLTKQIHSISDILLIKPGIFFGNSSGGNDFNDAQDCPLNFDDRIVRINAGWSSDTLDYITFVYSNGKSMQHGREEFRYSPYTYGFDLDPEENINGVTVYTDTRKINNPYESNGTYLIVGLRFYTNKGRRSELFGSSVGTKTNELFLNFTIAYARGKAHDYLNALQFIWYSKSSRSTIATLLTY